MTKVDAPKILVTRPEPGASATAGKLKTAGFNVVVQPFTQMVGKPVAVDGAELDDVTAIIVTSANALRYLPNEIAEKLSSICVFTVGETTRQEALRHGFDDVRSADGDAQSLIRLMRRSLKSEDHVLYLCGTIRTTDIEDELNRLQMRFLLMETYQTEKISQLTDKLNMLFRETDIDAVCFYSSVSTRLYADYFNAVSDRPKLLNISSFLISERAAEKLPTALKSIAYICEKPSDDAMVDLLVTHYCP